MWGRPYKIVFEGSAGQAQGVARSPAPPLCLCAPAGYVFVSYRLFNLTNDLKNAAVPHSNNALLARNAILLTCAGVTLYALCWGGTAVSALL